MRKAIKTTASVFPERKVQMEHALKISVSNKPTNGGIVACRHVFVRERLLRWLLGNKTRLTIIVPGDSVSELAISEIGKEAPREAV